MFPNLSPSSMSFATVTPSLVIRGAPYDFSSATLRPLGPSVTRTASARTSMPRKVRLRASTENFTCLADIAPCSDWIGYSQERAVAAVAIQEPPSLATDLTRDQ